MRIIIFKYLFTSFNNLTNFCSVFFLIFYNLRKAEKPEFVGVESWKLKVENSQFWIVSVTAASIGSANWNETAIIDHESGRPICSAEFPALDLSFRSAEFPRSTYVRATNSLFFLSQIANSAEQCPFGNKRTEFEGQIRLNRIAILLLPPCYPLTIDLLHST